MTRTVWVRAFGIVAASVLLLIPAMAQSKGGRRYRNGDDGHGHGTGTPGTGAGTAPTVGRPTSPTPNTTQPNPTISIPQPIFLSGRVMMEDGTSPTEPMVIETVCNGVGHSEGYTDAKGFFAIELGANRGVIQDASEFSVSNSNPTLGGGGAANTNPAFSSAMGGGSERKYMGCDLQVKAAGYRSQAVPLAGRRPMDDPNVGTILLHRLGKTEEGLTISAVSLAAPKDAKKAYDKGMDALKKKKYADAQASFEKAVELYPKYSVAWYELGRLRIAEDQLDIRAGRSMRQ